MRVNGWFHFFFLCSLTVEMCDGGGGSIAAYFKSDLWCAELSCLLNVARRKWVSQFLYFSRTNCVAEVITHCVFLKLSHLHLWQISRCLFRASLFSVRFAGGQPHSSGNERSVGLNYMSVIAEELWSGQISHSACVRLCCWGMVGPSQFHCSAPSD